MNITKELYDTLKDIGFTFPPPLEINQTEPAFLNVIFVSKTLFGEEYSVMIRNSQDLDLDTVISSLVNSVREKGFKLGHKAGQSAVGNYLKQLIEQ